jgi:hypothetical protein
MTPNHLAHLSSGDILMTSGSGAPPLLPPQPPAVAARANSQAARAAADAWTQPMDSAEYTRAISQLYSILRDLGIATRGLARYQTTGNPADSAPPDFARLVAASAEWLLGAGQSLDGVLAAEGLGPVPDPEEPGAMLCRAARHAITAWRQPAGTSAERDTTIQRLIAGVGFLATATRSLTTYAPRRRITGLQAVAASLAEVTACLAKTLQPPQVTQHPDSGAAVVPFRPTRRPRNGGR